MEEVVRLETELMPWGYLDSVNSFLIKRIGTKIPKYENPSDFKKPIILVRKFLDCRGTILEAYTGADVNGFNVMLTYPRSEEQSFQIRFLEAFQRYIEELAGKKMRKIIYHLT